MQQTELDLVDVLLHAAAGNQRAVAGVGPLMIRTDEPPDRAARLVADLRAAMSADVPERVDLAVVAANHDQRIVADGEREVVAGIADFARMTDEQPAAPPDPLDLGAIDQLARNRTRPASV